MRREFCHGYHTNKTVRHARKPADYTVDTIHPIPDNKLTYNIIRKAEHLGTCDKCGTRRCGDADPAQKKRPAKPKRLGQVSGNIQEAIQDGWAIYHGEY